MASIRRRTYEVVEAAREHDATSRVFDFFILSLIFLNVLAVIVDSVASMREHYESFFHTFEIVSVIIFTVEYLARLWSCTTDPEFEGAIRGRLRFALRAIALIDLLAILPFYCVFLGIDLRALRIFRLLRLAKVCRYYSPLNNIRQVLIAKKQELILSTVLMGLLMVVSSTLLYYCENPAQPEAFSSIPATMWWSIATLSTVGYGDMYPITGLGKFFASVIAVLGIGMFALPTGILGAGFVEALQGAKEKTGKCPHCGKELQ
ncbi:MAG: ion transporter [bacterium]